RLMTGARGPDPPEHVRPDLARLTTLSAQIGAAGYFVFAVIPNAEDHLTEARMFCPALGISEDPVSGNAHGLLGAYLARLGLLRRNGERAQFSGVQGYSLHRPGRVEIELEFAGGELAGGWISGQAGSIFETGTGFCVGSGEGRRAPHQPGRGQRDAGADEKGRPRTECRVEQPGAEGPEHARETGARNVGAHYRAPILTARLFGGERR